MKHVALEPYVKLAEQGASPLDVALTLRARDVGLTETITVLRRVFPLAFVNAKDVATQAFYGMGLAEYQETYIVPLLEELEREGFWDEMHESPSVPPEE